MTREAELVGTMVDLGDTLCDDFDIVDLLTRLSDGLVAVLSVDAAGIILVDDAGELRVVASSSGEMRGLEVLELQSDEGPCLDCIRLGAAVSVDDLTSETVRWREFAPRAVDAGFRSADAVPMRLRDELIGAVNLFRHGAGGLDATEVRIAQAFADIATIAILQHRALDESRSMSGQLQSALSSRVVIEQAKGIVAERAGIGLEEAFVRLRRTARDGNRRLDDVAAEVVGGRGGAVARTGAPVHTTETRRSRATATVDVDDGEKRSAPAGEGHRPSSHEETSMSTPPPSPAPSAPPSTGPSPGSADVELDRERTFGGDGVDVEREIRVIDLSASSSQGAIDDAIWSAASEIGFFQVVGHGIDVDEVERAFALAEAFFALPEDTKARRSMPSGTNSGWEFRSQKRPSTGTLDHKETFQVTISRMDTHDLWPTEDELAGFRSTMEAFEAANHAIAMRVLSTFARRLGFDDDFFAERHDRSSSRYQSTLRLLHHLPMATADLRPGEWRAGAHTDFDCLTLLHQREGQSGLQVCPGAAAAARSSDAPLGWTDVEPSAGTITCNIGDMLMRWSDGALPSTLHRVRMPRPDEVDGDELGPRYSMAYFAQADCDAVIESPSGSFEPITAADYLQQRIAANFSR
ncbi:ANTAR domain-containing protein [Ilumatobacter sp.]|uniref:ANTAR domain-containing protein n=1 Tax=Ilumatobacter sp. TaxID=1967498 RepID=UPI003B52C9E0